VRLFLDRAAGAAPGFALTDRNVWAVAEVCRRLDGIPLAIELAAARMRGLTVEEIRARLDDRFRLLTGGSRTALPRQQTLRALIDWSYDLLGEPERALLRRLSVFAGGWTLAAAEAVCSGEPVPAEDVLDLLLRLVDKSLVQPEGQGAGTRYRLLETIRQYAREKLAESGEPGPVRDRHLRFFRELAEEGEPALRGPEQLVWLERLETEHDNLRAALDWSLMPGQAEAGLAMAAALRWFWHLRGYWGEGRARLEAALARAGSGTAPANATRARALEAVGRMASNLGDFGAAAVALTDSISLCRALGDRLGLAASLTTLSYLLNLQEGHQEPAISLAREGLAVAHEAGADWETAFALLHLGVELLYLGDFREARALGDEGLTTARWVGDRFLIARALNCTYMAAYVEGDHRAAGLFAEESLRLSRELGERLMAGISLSVLGKVARQEGDHRRALTLAWESLEGLLEIGMTWGASGALVDLAPLASAGHGEAGARRASRLLGAAQAIHDALGSAMFPINAVEYDRLRLALRAAIGEEAFASA
jgi:non-specific serine/threonine protein kinase